MKKILNILFPFALLFVNLFCVASTQVQEIAVTNKANYTNEDAAVIVQPSFSSKGYKVLAGDKELPHQFVNNGQLLFITDIGPGETQKIKISASPETKPAKYQSRTYAELAMKPTDVYYDKKFRGDKFISVTKIKVPAIHTDHDALFKYEGPGWESEKVGYRFYLDWRNATDIFGKKVNGLFLRNTGVHDTVANDDSYHNMQDWGMDIFKVGNSLGIGSIGIWYDGKVNMVSKTDSIYCEITENGPVRSAIKTNYYGWQVGKEKFNLEAVLSIGAGSRLTKTEITIDKSAANIVTGLAKYKGTSFAWKKGESGWGYISLYGNQTLVNENDKLGIAIIYKNEQLIEPAEDALSHILKLKPSGGKVEYYFCAAWEQEPNGIKSEKEFIEYLERTIALLNNPPEIKY